MVNGRFLTNCKINQLLKHDYGTKFGAVISPPLPLPRFLFSLNPCLQPSHRQGKGREKISPVLPPHRACASINYSNPADPPAPLTPRPAKRKLCFPQPQAGQRKGELEDELAIEKKSNSLLTNHYLAGFTDSDGYFGISTPSPIRLIPEIPCSSKVLTEHKRSADIILPLIGPCVLSPPKVGGVGAGGRLVREGGYLPLCLKTSFTQAIRKLGEREGGVRFIFVLGQKDPTILQRVKYEFGGYLYHYKPTDNYLLELSSLSQNLQIIEYFDHYNLNSIKHLAFFKWRKAYRIVQRKEHLTEKGLSKIKLLGKSISELIK